MKVKANTNKNICNNFWCVIMYKETPSHSYHRRRLKNMNRELEKWKERIFLSLKLFHHSHVDVIIKIHRYWQMEPVVYRWVYPLQMKKEIFLLVFTYTYKKMLLHFSSNNIDIVMLTIQLVVYGTLFHLANISTSYINYSRGSRPDTARALHHMHYTSSRAF